MSQKIFCSDFIFCEKEEIMSINFCGFKNIGYMSRKFEMGQEDGSQREHIDEKFLSIQLIDDRNSKDLTEYKKALSTSDLLRTPNPIGREFLNIAIIDEALETDLGMQKKRTFYINDDELEINDKNLPFLSYIVKLVKKVSRTPEEEFVHNRDFVEGPEALYSVLLEEDVDEAYAELAEPIKQKVFEPVCIKYGANKMYNDFQNSMMDYFA